MKINLFIWFKSSKNWKLDFDYKFENNQNFKIKTK